MKLTIKETDDVIQKYCEEHSCLATLDDKEQCKIKHLCDECGGDFEGNPISCEKAYHNINGYDLVKVCDKPDMVNNPPHYTQNGMECIDELLMIFGKEAVMHFCLCNAWKYRKRAIFKNGKEDIEKSDWYINKYKELSDGLNTI